MDWKDLGKKIAAVGLPLLGAALPLPGGAALGQGLAAALGLGADASPQAIDAALATPEARLQAQQFALQHEQVILNITTTAEIERERIAAGDRASAREREVKTADSWTPRGLAALVVGGFLFAVYMVLAGRVPGLNDPVIAGMVGTLIGYASAKADQVVSYYFGSSAGSARKDELLLRR